MQPRPLQKPPPKTLGPRGIASLGLSFPLWVWGEEQKQQLPSLPGCFILAAQCAFACMPGLCLCVATAPPPVLSVWEVAAGTGGASLGLRRLRHVLDTGLSGLELKHKGLGRRRNKGLFHAATEKLQISKSGVQAGGARLSLRPSQARLSCPGSGVHLAPRSILSCLYPLSEPQLLVLNSSPHSQLSHFHILCFSLSRQPSATFAIPNTSSVLLSP